MQKASRGETLTDEEKAYLERVKQKIRERAMGKNPNVRPQGPSKSSARPLVVNQNDWKPLIPITDITALYKGEDGGLYGGGSSEPPEVPLRDLNGDGEAELYENFKSDTILSSNAANCDLDHQIDSAGNFYFGNERRGCLWTSS